MAELVAAPTSIEKLPPEILKLILSNLDEKELLPCRLVNPSWKEIGNEILREKSSLWNNTFGVLFVCKGLTKGRVGTRFSTPEQITQFILEMKTANPFPNGTVIFIPDNNLDKTELLDFQANFIKLLEAFGDAILNLVYSSPLNASKTDLSDQMRAILTLKKMKSLVIEQCFQWGQEQFLEASESQWLPKTLELTESLPEKLQELHIHGWSGVIPLFYLFDGIESALKNVSSLVISNKVGGPGHPYTPGQRVQLPLCQFPNLQKLKMRFPDAEFLKQFEQFQPGAKRLKEISFYFDFSYDKGGEGPVEMNLKEIFELVDLHAETLELLHLDFAFQKPDSLLTSNGLFTPVKYPKLKVLILQYERIHLWPPSIDELMAKPVNLQEFKISLPYFNPRAIFKQVGTFWDRIPATVKVVSNPEYGWEVKRGETPEFDEA